MEHYKIGLCCTPAKIKNHEVIDVFEMKVTYGGGLGGSVETHYITDYHLNSMDFFVVTFINGLKEKFNKRYVVSIKPKKVVKVVTDITEHVNYREFVTNEPQIKIIYYVLNLDDTYEVITEYGKDNLNIKKVTYGV